MDLNITTLIKASSMRWYAPILTIASLPLVAVRLAFLSVFLPFVIAGRAIGADRFYTGSVFYDRLRLFAFFGLVVVADDLPRLPGDDYDVILNHSNTYDGFGLTSFIRNSLRTKRPKRNLSALYDLYNSTVMQVYINIPIADILPMRGPTTDKETGRAGFDTELRQRDIDSFNQLDAGCVLIHYPEGWMKSFCLSRVLAPFHYKTIHRRKKPLLAVSLKYHIFNQTFQDAWAFDYRTTHLKYMLASLLNFGVCRLSSRYVRYDERVVTRIEEYYADEGFILLRGKPINHREVMEIRNVVTP